MTLVSGPPFGGPWHPQPKLGPHQSPLIAVLSLVGLTNYPFQGPTIRGAIGESILLAQKYNTPATLSSQSFRLQVGSEHFSNSSI